MNNFKPIKLSTIEEEFVQSIQESQASILNAFNIHLVRAGLSYIDSTQTVSCIVYEAKLLPERAASLH